MLETWKSKLSTFIHDHPKSSFDGSLDHAEIAVNDGTPRWRLRSVRSVTNQFFLSL